MDGDAAKPERARELLHGCVGCEHFAHEARDAVLPRRFDQHREKLPAYAAALPRSAMA